jgi:hypothetical protein
MKRQLILLTGILFALLSGTLSYGQLLIENFDYPAGDALTNHGWTQIRSGTNPISISSPGLEYTGYASSGIGNTAYLPKNSEEVMKSFSEQTTGSVYIALLLKVSDASATTSGYTFLYLGPQGAGLSNRHLSLYMRKDQDDHVSFGICKAGGIYYTDYDYALNTTYLIVAKYMFYSGSPDDDELHLWINPPVDGTEPTADCIEASGGDASGLSEIVLSQNQQDPAVFVDGLVVTTDWPIIPTAVSQKTPSFPNTFRLYQNFPNPFNPSTTIRFDVMEPAHVELILFDILGKRIRTLTQGHYDRGSYEINLESGDLSTGIYVCTIQMGSYRSSRKLFLMK